MLHGLVSSERPQTLAKIGRHLTEARGQNVNCVRGAHRRWLSKNIQHNLHVNQNPWYHKGSRGRKINIAGDQQKLQHVVVELGLTSMRLVGS